MAIDTIGTNAIANDAVTAAKIPAGAVDADITAIPDGSVTTAKIADNAVTSAKALNLGRRNLVINGAMQIAQRGTSFTSATTAYHVDRFIDVMNLGAWTVSQSTDSPDEFSNSWKWDCTTANGSLASNSELIFVTRLEGQNLQHLKYGTSSAESLTLSFWVKSSKTGTYTCEFDQYGDRQISRTYTINSANTWEKKILTVPGDTGGSIDNDNSAEFQLLWWLGAGSNLTSGTLNTSAWAGVTNANRVSSSQVNLADNTANDWYITGIQLETGDTATDFEHRSYGEELLLCQRYYQKIIGTYGSTQGLGTGFGSNNTVTTVDIFPPVKSLLRDQSSISFSAASGFTINTNAIADSCSSVNAATYSNNHVRAQFTCNSADSGTVSGPRLVRMSGTGTYIAWDSEL